MKLEEILLEVKNLIQDDSFEDGYLISCINDTIKQVADEVNLPSLKCINTVDTVVGQNYASLTGISDGFSGRLGGFITSDITIYHTLEDLLSNYVPDIDQAGAVEGVALEGTILWYQKIPAVAQTLTFVCYKNPTILSTPSSTPPVDIHESLHRSLFVNGTAFNVYNLIEDGVEGEKVNTKSHFWQSFDLDNKHSGIVKLKESLARKRSHRISSIWNY